MTVKRFPLVWPSRTLFTSREWPHMCLPLRWHKHTHKHINKCTSKSTNSCLREKRSCLYNRCSRWLREKYPQAFVIEMIAFSIKDMRTKLVGIEGAVFCNVNQIQWPRDRVEGLVESDHFDSLTFGQSFFVQASCTKTTLIADKLKLCHTRFLQTPTFSLTDGDMFILLSLPAFRLWIQVIHSSLVASNTS